ncbi:MAG: prepilin peptidase [Candidatus Omnitrophica bacterium]|nr:prepilin peptidase [Candidatus Omnitrophota bacterium]MCM8831566.1 prepilin peptidase [Candidatus Omnitrophota bacterium]
MPEKVIFFILGSIIGSFLNVCIWRLPKDISIIKPFSFCPKCKKTIKWYDNIPLLSFILLKARCRYCKEKISFRYPFVELLAGIFFVILYSKFGISLNFLKYAFFFMFLIVVSFIDIDYHAIPAYLCILAIAVALIFSFVKTVDLLKTTAVNIKALPIFKTLRNLIFGLGFTYFFKLFGDIFISIYLAIRKKDSIEGERESLGLGDVDFMGVVASFLGLQSAIIIFFLAPFIAIIYAIFAIIFKRSHLLPYLPYLSLASTVVFFWKEHILRFIGFNF